jgi:hypothetical protein
MSASRENLLRAQRQLDALHAACKAAGIQGDARLEAAEAAYLEAKLQHRRIQREKIAAGVGFAVACAGVGVSFELPAWGVTAIFLGGVGAIALLTL